MIKKPRPKHSMKLEDGDEIRLEKIELSSAHKTEGTFSSFIINQSLLKPGFTKF